MDYQRTCEDSTYGQRTTWQLGKAASGRRWAPKFTYLHLGSTPQQRNIGKAAVLIKMIHYIKCCCTDRRQAIAMWVCYPYFSGTEQKPASVESVYPGRRDFNDTATVRNEGLFRVDAR